MSEATQTQKEPTLYDASARNRFEYELAVGGLKYDVAHVFGPVSDERYMQWLRDLKVKGNQDDVSEESREATAKLWDDTIVELEGVEYDEGADWRSLVDSSQKLEAVNNLFAVSIVEPEEKASGKLKLGQTVDTVVVTEAFFNGEILQQTHTLQPKSFEFEKIYERIQSKRLKPEKITGLSKRKAKIEYVPQDDKLGELYDEMCNNVEGFQMADETNTYIPVPLRFKTLVVNYIFAPKLDQKKLGK